MQARAYFNHYELDSRIETLHEGERIAKRAIQIDPKFVMAYASLGFEYGLLGEPALAAENTRKAYEMRDRTSDREQHEEDQKAFHGAAYRNPGAASEAGLSPERR